MVTIPASQTKHFPKNMVQLLRSPRYSHGSTVPPPPSDRDEIKEKEFHRGEVSSPCEPTTQLWTYGRVPALLTAFPSALFCAVLASAAVATAVFDPVTDVGPVFLKCVFLPPIPPRIHHGLYVPNRAKRTSANIKEVVKSPAPAPTKLNA